MNKWISGLVLTAFATASVGVFAGAHGGGMSDKDNNKAGTREACSKLDAKASDKMKADCKKMLQMKADNK